MMHEENGVVDTTVEVTAVATYGKMTRSVKT